MGSSYIHKFHLTVKIIDFYKKHKQYQVEREYLQVPSHEKLNSLRGSQHSAVLYGAKHDLSRAENHTAHADIMTK